MFEWSETDLLIRDSIREFVDKEIRPHVDELESGALPPYDIIRRLFAAFGMDALASESLDKVLAKHRDPTASTGDSGGSPFGGQESLALIAVSELAGVSLGIVASMGVSIGLTAQTILTKGTPAQQERWLPKLVTFEHIGAWAITEPGSGSDAFGGMTTTVRRDGSGGAPANEGVAGGGDYVLNGQKTFITNGPHADVIVVYAKLDTGDGRDSARSSFAVERVGVAALALGIINECHRLCVDYARQRTLWGREIGQFQLIQLKLARMEIARINVRNMVFSAIEKLRAGKSPDLAEASAMKLYASEAATEVAMEAVQLFGGNGYMTEYRVEQLARDAKSLMIYAGSNEIQVTHIAKALLAASP